MGESTESFVLLLDLVFFELILSIFHLLKYNFRFLLLYINRNDKIWSSYRN
jgi:hypothetical protein